MEWSSSIMMGQSVKENRMSLPMQDLQQRQTTKSIISITGERSKHVPKDIFQSPLPEMEGKQFGKLTVISDVATVIVESGTKRKRTLVLTQCSCGEIAWKNLDNVKRGIAGCRVCDKPRIAPKWLVQRCISAKCRCENPQDPRFKDYGARGIRFCFKGPTEMALWLMEHFDCSDRKMQIDRINNNGNYEPGNVRMTTPSINAMNTRHQLKIKMLRFRESHLEIRYADATLCRLLGKGFSEEEIVKRFYQKSCKPKGVYGTFSMPDQDIVSQLMVY